MTKLESIRLLKEATIRLEKMPQEEFFRRLAVAGIDDVVQNEYDNSPRIIVSEYSVAVEHQLNFVLSELQFSIPLEGMAFSNAHLPIAC